MIRVEELDVTEFPKKISREDQEARKEISWPARTVKIVEEIERAEFRRKRSAQLHVRCREAKNSANR